MKKKANFHVACYMVIEEDNKILLQKRANSGYFDGYYSIPGGHLEEKERCIDCIIREVKEEIDVNVYTNDIKLIYTLGTMEDSDYICLFFTTNKYDGKIRIMENDKCSELAFFDLDKLPNNLVPELKTFLKDRKNGLIYGDERLK
jgi:8-oxo-dGTP diphosphatase